MAVRSPVHGKGAPPAESSPPKPIPAYVFSVVGTSRCDVRAACSGATPSNASVARKFVPPATARAGTAQRAIPTIALNTYRGEGRLPAAPAAAQGGGGGKGRDEMTPRV